MHQASGMLGRLNNEDCRENIFKPYLACALEPNCLYPDDGLKIICNGDSRKSAPHVCHRYDQAAITIIAGNYYGYETSKYVRKAMEQLREHTGGEDFRDMDGRRVERKG